MYNSVGNISFTFKHNDETKPTKEEILSGLAKAVSDLIKHPDEYVERVEWEDTINESD